MHDPQFGVWGVKVRCMVHILDHGTMAGCLVGGASTN